MISQHNRHFANAVVYYGSIFFKPVFAQFVMPAHGKIVRETEIFALFSRICKLYFALTYLLFSKRQIKQIAVYKAPGLRFVHGQNIFFSAENEPAATNAVWRKQYGIAEQINVCIPLTFAVRRPQNFRV